MIRRMVLRGILSNPLRFLLTTLAVFVGVAFVSTAFGLTDQLRGVIKSTDVASSGSAAKNQLIITPKSEGFGPPGALSEDVLNKVSQVDGVADASPSYYKFIQIDIGNAPTTPGGVGGVATPDELRDSNWKVVSGTAPATADQVAFDADALSASNKKVGDSVDILLPTGRRAFTISAEVARVGSEPGGLFAFVKSDVVFAPGELQKVISSTGAPSAILITMAPGVDPAAVKPRLKAVLPKGADVVSGEELNAQTKELLSQVADGIERAMLIFAGVTLFVGTFLVVNTFSMVVAQRTRELGLLRAVGSDRKMVFSMVTAEAAFIGAIASAFGLGIGLVASMLLGHFINSSGGYHLIITPRTVGMALLIGLGVTIISAIAPAMAASRVEPLAAINGVNARQVTRRWTTIVAGITLAAAIAMLIFGFAGDHDGGTRLALLAPGAVLLFVSLAMLSRFLARPVMAALGLPLRRKLTARMAASNASRNPRRTATTASALMIGVALIVCVVTVGTSIKTALLDQYSKATTGTYYVQGNGFASIDPGALRDSLAKVKGVGAAVDYSVATGDLRSPNGFHVTQMSATTFDGLSDVFDLGITKGSLDGASETDVMLSRDTADSMKVGVGDTVKLSNPAGESAELKVIGVYTRTAVFGDAVVDRREVDKLALDPNFQGVAIKAAPGANLTELRTNLKLAGLNFPSTEVKTPKELEDKADQQFAIVLTIISALLGASVLVAGLGVTNTLVLSVVERTREIGLTRAVGGTRKQLRSIVRIEALMTSTFGAILGIVVGSGLGIGIVSALPDNFVGHVTFPVGAVIACLVLAIVLGALAALWPAWRASRLDVLKALHTQ